MIAWLRHLAQGAKLPAAALGGLVAVCALLVWLTGADPWAAAEGLWQGAFGDVYGQAETVVTAVPLAIVALGVAPAVRAGIFPVGSEGQMALGALAATAALRLWPAGPPAALLAMGCAAGIAGGAAWALLPALLRAYARVNEILSTLLMNTIAANLLLWSLRGWLGTRQMVATPRSDHLPAAALIPKLIDGTRLHWGIVAVVLGAVALGWWVRSARGLAVDVFATHPALARRLGIEEPATVLWTMLICGGAAGLAGWVQLAGLLGTLYPSVAGGLGFSGILVALLGGLAPLGILAAALVLAVLTTGSQGMQIGTGVPSSIATVIQGLLLLAVALVFAARARRARLAAA